MKCKRIKLYFVVFSCFDKLFNNINNKNKLYFPTHLTFWDFNSVYLMKHLNLLATESKANSSTNFKTTYGNIISPNKLQLMCWVKQRFVSIFSSSFLPSMQTWLLQAILFMIGLF